MTLAWMLYALAIGAAISVIAAAADRVARLWERPGRFIWAAAVIVSLVGPAIVAAAVLLAPVGAQILRLPPIVVTPGLAPVARLAPTAWPAMLPVADRIAVGVWLGASFVMLLLVVRAAVHLHRARRRWRETHLDGQPVLVSDTIGPATIGVRDARVVMPAWLLDMEPALRELAVLHECEHARAGDGRLVLLRVAALILAPWNLALWYQARRLRLAIEIDCDARVLRQRPDVRRYAALLLTVSHRRGQLSMLVAALTERPTTLQRRIVAMSAARPKLRLAQLLVLVLVSAGVVVIACETPTPPAPAPPFSTRLDTASVLRLPAAVTIADEPGASAQTVELRNKVAGSIGTVTVQLKPGGAEAEAMLRDKIARNEVQRASGKPLFVSSDKPFFEFQVEQPVVQAPGSPAPRYPDLLRQAKIEGEVLALYVVDERGVADTATFKVLKSSHDLFTAAVKAALPEMRFKPALVGGRPVKQLVRQPFTFSISR
jgi:bla regulator protein blaR1